MNPSNKQSNVLCQIRYWRNKVEEYIVGQEYWITNKITGARTVAICLGYAYKSSQEVSFQDFHHNIYMVSELSNIEKIS